MALVTVRSPQCSSNSDAEADDEESNKNERSECFFAGKGSALVLPLKDCPPNHAERRLSTDSVRSTNSTQSNNSDIQQHLQSMFDLLKHEETLKMAVKLESNRPNRTRYLVIASRCCYRSTTDRKNKLARNNSAKSTSTTSTTSQISVDRNSNRLQQQSQSDQENIENILVESEEQRVSSVPVGSNRQSYKCDSDKSGSGDNKCGESMEESCLLGIDCNERTTIGLVVPILADTTIHLDGDGGFSVSVNEKTHIFKPVSVQAMWSALQTLHKVSQKAYKNNFYPGGPSHDWLTFYEHHIESDQSCLNEWNAMDSIESRRPPSPDAIRNKPTAKEETESVIRMKLKEIMMAVDLDEVTSKYIRGRLEEQLNMDLGEYKSFIDKEMLTILGQMDAPTEIFEHVYLGSEWNAFNLEELQKNGVRHILNVTREIDNFFPGMFDYFNVRVYDDEKTNLLKHWDNTYRYITRAKAEGSKVLVHCKMGVSRSASVVIAYAMKAFNWELQQALQHVKERRSCIKPNKNFLNQLETYRGMLVAMKNKEKLQRSKSETNLKSTKDARLLPGSEPTPLIQALNHTKPTTDSQTMNNDDSTTTGSRFGRNGKHFRFATSSSTSDQKHRRTVRRSSSISPKSIQNYTAIVIKQQSQSLENLTPERSVADEPKNVRYPGSNGENYSVTQNQVLHIQKNTPPSTVPPTSVRTMVHEMEAFKNGRKTADDRKLLNLQFGRAGVNEASGIDGRLEENSEMVGNTNVKSLGSPVWTSSAKLITQSSNLEKENPFQYHSLRSSLRSRRHTTADGDAGCNGAGNIFQNDSFNSDGDDKRRSRKTQSWAATSGFRNGIIMDAVASIGDGATSAIAKLGSNSSIESASSIATVGSSPAVSESCVRTRPRQREFPSRHASWGSGDTRCSVPMRNGSWGPYDSNRNSTSHYHRSTAASSAIFEGQIHDMNTSNKTATASQYQHQSNQNRVDNPTQHEIGKVKRTKQKLEASSVVKKSCIDSGLQTNTTTHNCGVQCTKKKTANLYRSASAATGGSRARFQTRCNSEEIVPTAAVSVVQHIPIGSHSDGCRSIHIIPPYSASAPDSYTISDIENKNMLSEQDLDNDSAMVQLRGAPDLLLDSVGSIEHQRISGNVQILKKNFEAKAGATPTIATCNCDQIQTASTKKGHHSLPSSPVAQHVEHKEIEVSTTSGCFEQRAAKIPNTIKTSSSSSTASSSSSSTSSSSSASVSEQSDRNVKNMIHRYQTSNSDPSSTSPYATTPPTNLKLRPRSYNENQYTLKSVTSKPHSYSENRPPPAPMKTSQSPTFSPPIATTSPNMTTTATTSLSQQQERQQSQVQQLRRMQPIKASHTRLFSQQNLNTAAYNTM